MKECYSFVLKDPVKHFSRVNHLENWHQALYCITVWFAFRAALQHCGTLLQMSWRSVVWLFVCLEVATVSHTSMRCGAWTSITAAQSECWVLRKTEFMLHLHCVPGRITGIRLYCDPIRQPLSDSSHTPHYHQPQTCLFAFRLYGTHFVKLVRSRHTCRPMDILYNVRLRDFCNMVLFIRYIRHEW